MDNNIRYENRRYNNNNRKHNEKYKHQNINGNKNNDIINSNVRKRINELHEERIEVQRKTFTKWMNSFLQKAKLNVDDIFVDLSDGIKLLKLLEIISGEKLGKPNNGTLRLQKIENVNKCLAFLHTKLKLECIGAEDIVDGNKKLILGLLWTIILRFQIQDIEIQDEYDTDKKKHSAKEALLLWCQRKTNNYPNCHVKDFTQSWRNGMAFNALIHSHRPDLIDYNALDPNNSIDNLNNAFKIAQDNLAIQPLLDPEDVDTSKPDEKSIMTYVSSYYHTFAKYNSEVISGKRITNIISQLMEIDRNQLNYELLTTNLLNWIKMKIHQLNRQESLNNLEEIQNELIKFKDYRTIEKPPKYRERSEIEAILFNIQTKRKALGQVLYVPNDGKLIQDINKWWMDLEKAEHRYELKLREELSNCERIEHMAQIFYRKYHIRKNFLNDLMSVLADNRYGNILTAIEATFKKHESISADIISKKERIDSLEQMAKELRKENYCNIDDVEKSMAEIKTLWNDLLAKLEMHQKNISTATNFIRTKTEIDSKIIEFNDIIKRINIGPNITHLCMADEYLHTHSLLETQISSSSETIERLINDAEKLLKSNQVLHSPILKNEVANLETSLNLLKSTHSALIEQSELKRQKLIKIRDYYRLLQDIDDEERTLTDKLNICQAILPGKDLLGIIRLQQKHSVFEAEIVAHENRIEKLMKKSKNFIKQNPIYVDVIDEKLHSLIEIWKQLQQISSSKSKELAVIIEAFQYHADANETESWLKEKMQIAKSEDYGNDEQSSQALLKRHNFLEKEVQAYSHEIERLNAQSDKMIDSDVESLFILGNKSNLFDTPINEELPIYDETITNINDDANTIQKIPQIRIMYDYKDKNCHVKKDEILVLIAKTTSEWWKVCRNAGDSDIFFVPSNYVQEIEPKIVRTTLPFPQQESTRKSPAAIKRRHSNRRLSIAYGADSVEKRKFLINTNYKMLIELCQKRKKSLEDTVKMFSFNSECDSFENWLNEMECRIQKSISLNTEQRNSQKQTSTDLSKEYDRIITDVLANRSRLDEIDRKASELNTTMYHSAVKKRKEQLLKKWEQINFLQKKLSKNIEGLSSVEIFDTAFHDTIERMNDKLAKVNDEYYDIDLKTAQSLQRKHENLERELIPISDSIKKLNIIGDNVKLSYPLEKSRIDKCLNELKQKWQSLRKCLDEKRDWLDKKIGLEIVKNSSKDINVWLLNYAKPLLKYDPNDQSFKNVKSLDTIIKEHNDLLVDLNGKANDIDEVRKLAEKLKNQIDPNELAVVDETCMIFNEIHQQWIDKNNFLRKCSDINLFNQEADRIDAMINSDFTFLEFNDIGNSCQDVYALIKRHEGFLDTLHAQDQLVHSLLDKGDKLIQNNHFDSEFIKERQNKIIERRKKLKEKAYLRQKVLNNARIYHEIRSDAEEFLNWCQNQQKQVDDLLNEKDNDNKNIESDVNVNRKIKKFQTIAAEVRAHRVQCEKILNDLNEINHNTSLPNDEFNLIETNVRNEWSNLNAKIVNNEKLITALLDSIEKKKSFQTISHRTNEIGKELVSNELPNDRRSCQKLLQKNKLIENDLFKLEEKLKNLKNNQSSDCEIDGDNVVHKQDKYNDKDYDELISMINQLKEPIRKRKKQLTLLNDYFQFQLDANAEMQWINEKIQFVSSNEMPQNLIDSRNWLKKMEQNLKNEVNTHQVNIDKLLTNANEFIENDHIESQQIRAISNELESKFKHLINLMNERIEKLKVYVRIHQFLTDCNEIESWLNDKLNILNNPIYGNDEITLIKLLQKQKSIDLEIDSYSGLIEELLRQADDLNALCIKNEKHDQKFKLKSRAKDLSKQLKRIQKLSNERNLKLIELKQFYEYYQESNDLLEWLLKQQQILSNEDYGKDYEHCLILQAKFFDQKRLILANEDHYKQCMKNGERFKRNDDDNDYNNHFTTNNEALYTSWQDIMNLLQAKEQKFIAAIKIHRFNRDVADAYERINEKYSILNNENYGRDCQSVQQLIRNHDIFVNDLVALEAQLQILINDSVKLKQSYGGGNAKQITEKLNSVLNYWEKLKKFSSYRSEKLYDTYELYRFISNARNLEQWSLNLINEMNINDEQIENELIKNNYLMNVERAQNAKSTHERIKSEIDHCESEFNSLVNDANQLTKNSFYNQIKEHTEKLLIIRNQLFDTWESKNISLDQLLDYCIYSREINQLEQLLQQFRNRLDAMEQGEAVEEVERNLKKFNEFVKLFESHDVKFDALKDLAKKLIEKNNKHSDKIQIRLDDLLKNKSQLWESILSRKEQLSDDLIFGQFTLETSETDSWIDEKKLQIEQLSQIDDKNKDDDIEIKLKKLQKHQSLEAEINANAARIVNIQEKAQHLIAKNHPQSIQIRTKLDDLTKKWDDLKTYSRNICEGFEEAKDIYEFNKNIARIESWIREKELMIQFNDTGEDFEHCSSLLKKLDDVGTDLKVDENEINQINQLADKLLNQCKNENQIDSKRLSLNEKWKQLQHKINDYRKRLNESLEIHSLNRDLDEINERIVEKHLLTSNECDVNSMTSAENAKRKHQAVCFDIHHIDTHFKNINDNDVRRLIGKNPDLMNKSREKIQIIQDNLRKLSQECSKKDQKLAIMIKLHKFFDSIKEFENWANEILANKLSNKLTSENVIQAENDIQDHIDLRAELDTKKANNQLLIDYGQNLINELKSSENDTYIDKINECIENNNRIRNELDESWNNKYEFLKQCKQLHKFNDLYKHSDSWLTMKEAFIANEDLGSNLANVNDLLKKFDSFEQSLNVQQKISDLSTFAQELIEHKHFDSHNIQTRLDEILDRRNKLMEAAKNRKNKLEQSKLFYNFLRSVNELNRWLIEKLKVANDESYNDSINLLSKKQKHAAFEAEINSNKTRIEKLIDEGENLLKNQHFRSEEIKLELDMIKKLYRQLDEATTFKRNRLNDAYQSLQFFRTCDALLLWIKDIETILNEQNNGKDLSSVRYALKKHQLLENDVHNHNENIENIKDQLANFQQNNHFLIDEIEEKGNHVIKCFNNLQKPLNQRHEILEEQLTFYQFKNDVEHEFSWIKEKENQLNQFDNTNTVLDIQRLLKRHKMLETEMLTREIQISALVTKGHNLLKAKCLNYEQIKCLTNELQQKIQYLKDAFALKRIHLMDSLEAQQFYSDIIEAESWINEKLSFLLNDDNGRDEESVSILLKRLDAITQESERFNSTTMAKLLQQSNQLIEKNHSECDQIKQKTRDLNAKYEQLKMAIDKKQKILSEQNSYYQFEREANELISWFKDQQIIANSEDYGQDVEHVESLIQQFYSFISFIMSSEDRIKSLESQAENVINSEEKMNEVRRSWNELKEMAARRQELLQSAEEVHRFYRSADETVYWIREKESSKIFDEIDAKYDDINTIKEKIHQLEGFERDLNAVREQVETLFAEADKLIDSFENVRDQIEERKNEVQEIWNNLNEKTKSHKANLIQIENIQSYFDHYQELLTWLNEMQALITSDDKLLTDVMAAEQQLLRHQEYENEIRAKNDNVQEFLQTGQKIITRGHIMSKGVEERNEKIKSLYENLSQTWEKRLKLYEYNVDARHFVRDVEQMEKWIESNHNYIDDNNFGESISDVEDLLLRHSEFEKTIEAQVEKLNKIERITLIEKYFDQLKREEQEQREAEKLRQEKEKLMAEEQRRIMYERLNEESKYYENVADKNRPSSSLLKQSSKSPRRYASFSFAKKPTKYQQLSTNLPQFSCKGFLTRKQLTESGGKRAESRNWKTYYAVLCGHLLCFFKDKNAFNKNSAATAPLTISDAKCEKTEYKHKKYVFSIELTDKSQYLFITTDDDRLKEWINAISFRASLPPSDQLIDYKRMISPASNTSASDVGTQNGATISDSSSSLSSLPEHFNGNKLNDNQEESNGDSNSSQVTATNEISKMSKYASLPANMEPIKEDSIYANDNYDNINDEKHNNHHNYSVKSSHSNVTNSNNNEKSKKKLSSFFKRK